MQACIQFPVATVSACYQPVTLAGAGGWCLVGGGRSLLTVAGCWPAGWYQLISLQIDPPFHSKYIVGMDINVFRMENVFVIIKMHSHF